MNKISMASNFKSFLVLTLLLFVSACTTPTKKPEHLSLRDNLLAGELQIALTSIETNLPGSNNVFTYMNKGMLQRMSGNYLDSNISFDKAKNLIYTLYGASISEKLGSAAFSDIVQSYAGSRYEQLLLHAYMAMNYIELHDLESARTEILQADVLMKSWSSSTEDDAFIRYLSAIIYEALGEYDDAIIDYRKAIYAYRQSVDKKYIKEVPRALIETMSRLLADQNRWDEVKEIRHLSGMQYFPHYKDVYTSPKNSKEKGELIIILSNGLTPPRKDVSTLTSAINSSHNYTYSTNYRKKVRASTAVFSIPLDTVVENVGVLANSSQQDLPGTELRVIIKTLEDSNKNKHLETPETFEEYLEYVKKIKTKVSDKRSWVTLPNTIQMDRLILPVGTYRLMITMYDKNEDIKDKISQMVSIHPEEISISTLHWVAPIKNDPLTIKAKLGDKHAQYELAKKLDDLYGLMKTSTSGVSAFSWYIKAAESNHLKAQLYLFGRYSNGLSTTTYKTIDGKSTKTVNVIIPQDNEKALKYLKMASENNDPTAMRHLANTYLKGWYDVEKDLNKSLALYEEIDMAIQTDKYLWSVRYPWDNVRIWGYDRSYFQLIKNTKTSLEKMVRKDNMTN